ncbi:MAG: hypothetical protein PVG07_02625 [Acidobacteriota bacterium]|jgi:hypothetical protein
MPQTEMTNEKTFRVRRWELGVLVLELLVLDASVLTGVLVGAPRLLDGVVDLPTAVWAGIGFFVLSWANVPLLTIYARSRWGREVPLGGMLITSFAGALGGGILFGLLT